MADINRDLVGFTPPPYPFDRLDAYQKIAASHEGGIVDLSIGTPCDPPPDAVVAALSQSGSERGYPASIGTEALRRSVARWMGRTFAIDVPISRIAACIGTKEFVATTPHYMKLRRPNRDTVIYPAVAYPTYEMGAILAGLRAVAVPMNAEGHMDFASLSQDDIDRALMVWVNSPSNPTGGLDDLKYAANWGRAHNIPIFSDECYTEFTWSTTAQSILQHGLDGVVAVHSLSKRSNLAGVRVGFYAGDADIVEYLKEVRKHAGFMVPGPAQAAGVAALDDDAHVKVQRDRYRTRLESMAQTLSKWSGIDIPLPDGGFYLWFPVDDAWAFTEKLAREGGALVSPGDFYGPAASKFVRVAVVQPDAKLSLVAQRLRA
ncbi:MAG: aminotransferase class I/II-fold pyridoxal phosphate-dependent enzyme [Acidimicrobiaceae bacterium]|jgi:succinyldiaminopimelate transaminase|nr:aminotransferase class I/II-fold pyridoxal phosphate-dependent enzyme [Ilumatobacteraceae bacterium]